MFLYNVSVGKCNLWSYGVLTVYSSIMYLNKRGQLESCSLNL